MMKNFFNFEKDQKKLVILLILPTLIVVFGILLFPLIYSFIMSFGDVEITNINDYDFIGFSNYIRAFKDPEFISSLKVSAKFIIASISIKLILGILIAVILKERFFGRGIVRTLVIIPWATPYVVTGLIWKWILNSKVGIVNLVLFKAGIIDEYKSFLTDKFFALASIVIADVWQGTPFFIIIILAGLQTIPDQLYESAVIDGANGIKSFFFITLPLVRFPILVSTILGTVISVNAFDLFYILTKGGPGIATTNLTLFDWNNAFKFHHLSYASAISYLILLITLGFSIVYIYLLRKEAD